MDSTSVGLAELLHQHARVALIIDTAGDPDTRPPLGIDHPITGDDLPDADEVAEFGWADCDPAGWVLDAMAGTDVRELDAAAALDRIAALEKLASRVAAEQATALSAFIDRRRVAPFSAHEITSDRDRAIADEVAVTLLIASRTADSRLSFATDLQQLPGTLQAMRAGQASVGKAQVLIEETRHLTGAQKALVEERALPGVEHLTPGQLRRKFRRAVQRIDPDAAVTRRKEAARKRAVQIDPEPEGMATISARLSAIDATAVYNRLDQYARAAKAAGDDRSMEQLRADALLEILCHGAGPAARPLVRITIPADAVLGHSDQPGELAGYGPVDASLVREIMADAAWQRITTDPETGAILDLGRRRYRPSERLAEIIRARDGTCVVPACLMPAHRCDIDHVCAWSQGGGTDRCNLCALCRRHHKLKDEGWDLHTDGHGNYTWTAPTGRAHTSASAASDRPPF